MRHACKPGGLGQVDHGAGYEQLAVDNVPPAATQRVPQGHGSCWAGIAARAEGSGRHLDLVRIRVRVIRVRVRLRLRLRVRLRLRLRVRLRVRARVRVRRVAISTTIGA